MYYQTWRNRTIYETKREELDAGNVHGTFGGNANDKYFPFPVITDNAVETVLQFLYKLQGKILV